MRKERSHAQQRRALCVGVACCLLTLAGCGQTSHHSASTPTTAATTAASKSTAPRKIDVGGAPIGLLAYGGQLWVADAESNRLLRVEPDSGRVTARVPVGRTPLRIVAFDGSIWSTDFRAGTVSQVSPTSLRRTAVIHVGPQPEGIIALGSSLWVVSQQGGYLTRITPPRRHIAVGNQPRQVTAGGGYLWVSVFGDNTVAQVDPRTQRVVARIQACVGPQGLAYANGHLWVGCANDGEFVDIDPHSRRVVHKIPYNAADAVSNTDTGLRVTSDDGPSTAVLDPVAGNLTHNVKLSDAFIGDANADVVSTNNRVWVSSPDEGAVYEVP